MNNDFDDKLKEFWEQKQFPVDPDHRTQMLELLNKNDRRRVGIFWWIGGIGITMMVAGLLVFNRQEQPVKEQLKPAPNTSTMPNNDIAESQESASISSKNEIPSSGQTKSNAHKSPSIVPDKKMQTSNVASSGKNQTNGAKKSLRKSETRISNKNASLSTPSNALQEELFPAAPNINHGEKIVIRQQVPVAVSIPASITVIPDSVEFDTWSLTPALRNSTITEPLESLLISDVTNPPYEFNPNIEPHFSNIHFIRLFAETGIGFIPSVNNQYSSGWTFNAGAGLSYKLGVKTSLLFSLGYLYQNGGFDFQRTSAVQQTGFGFRSNFNTLNPDKLHFVYSKFGVQYNVKRQLISVNGGLQWLYGAQGNISVKTVDQLSGTTEVSQYAWLSTDGMRRFIWSGEALYGYRITPRLIVRGGVKYYFSDINNTDPALSDEGYYWTGQYASFTPSFTINYHLYGNR